MGGTEQVTWGGWGICWDQMEQDVFLRCLPFVASPRALFALTPKTHKQRTTKQ